mmetsp:Transcript_144664/g.403118  ORF Transcript_144664/g.403118 Transcript_144664/m.403118 type:complete len:380 (-) Transcript_144664:47-1186(-)
MPSRRCPSSVARTWRPTVGPCAPIEAMSKKRLSTRSSRTCGPARESRSRTLAKAAATTSDRGVCGAMGTREEIAGRGGTWICPCLRAPMGGLAGKSQPSLVRRLPGSKRPSPSLSVSIMSHSSCECVRYGSACISVTRNSCGDACPWQRPAAPSLCSAGASRFSLRCSRDAASAGTPALSAASAAASSWVNGSAPPLCGRPQPPVVAAAEEPAVSLTCAKTPETSAREMPKGSTLTAWESSSGRNSSGFAAKSRKTSKPGPGAALRPASRCAKRRSATSARAPSLPAPTVAVDDVLPPPPGPIGGGLVEKMGFLIRGDGTTPGTHGCASVAGATLVGDGVNGDWRPPAGVDCPGLQVGVTLGETTVGPLPRPGAAARIC